jgi:hypothetical protein
MDIVHIVIILIVIGILLWLANTYLPMDAMIKKIMNIVVIVAVVLWLLSIFFPGVMSGFHTRGGHL